MSTTKYKEEDMRSPVSAARQNRLDIRKAAPEYKPRRPLTGMWETKCTASQERRHSRNAPYKRGGYTFCSKAITTRHRYSANDDERKN